MNQALAHASGSVGKRCFYEKTTFPTWRGTFHFCVLRDFTFGATIAAWRARAKRHADAPAIFAANRNAHAHRDARANCNANARTNAHAETNRNATRRNAARATLGRKSGARRCRIAGGNRTETVEREFRGCSRWKCGRVACGFERFAPRRCGCFESDQNVAFSRGAARWKNRRVND